MELISLENLHFAYATQGGPPLPVLKNLTLKIQQGELLAIQGPSGSGKSTLLYIIGCLLNSYRGTVRIAGQDIATLNDQQLALLRNQMIGFVFQQFHLLPKATVLENILLPSQYPCESPRSPNAEVRALQLAKELGLGDRLHHFPNQLSGGQQQRVSIARALLNDTQILLADEPTGSLDTGNSRQIMEILKGASRLGRTVIIITHDPEVAKQCDRIVNVRDGEIVEIRENRAKSSNPREPLAMQLPNLNKMKNLVNRLSRYFTTGWALLPLALQSLRQNRSRSILTMIGIVIGVAAVLAMVTVGAFTKRKILDSYADLGVNTVVFYGRPNWELRATDQVPTVFQAFDWERDLIPIKRIFPQVLKLSPILQSWDNKVTFGGITIDSDVRGYGVSEDGLKITKRELAIGHNFSPFHIQNRSAVCIIGYEIYERLFSNVSPLGQIVYLIQRDSSFGCRVIGVLKSQTSNNDWNKPNLNVYLPYTFFQGISDPWNSRIHQVVMDIQSGSDIERVGLGVKSFFERKYGKSGHFRVGSDSVLIAQMNKFLSLFTVLLGAIAMVSLAVGGIGITNMMLVSVSERLKEIGIRKAFGATDFSIRVQYLVESIGICSVAGLVGLVAGFVLYQGAIYGATKLVPKLQFEWIIHFPALLLSILSIFLVGVLSGLVPAFKAERLQVIEALRSD